MIRWYRWCIKRCSRRWARRPTPARLRIRSPRQGWRRGGCGGSMPPCRPAARGGRACHGPIRPALGRSLEDAAAEPWGLLRDCFLPLAADARLPAARRAIRRRQERTSGTSSAAWRFRRRASRGGPCPPAAGAPRSGPEARRSAARPRRLSPLPSAAAGRPSSCWRKSTS